MRNAREPEIAEAVLWPTFDDWWELYDRKADRKKCEGKWNRLDHPTKTAIMEHTRLYVTQGRGSDPKYRRDPATYLNNENWNDDELTLLLNPETFLFGNPVAQAACAGDCVLSTTGFGSNALFWCSGCNGGLYPLNGHVQAHVSPIQASSLLVHRMTAKMHRQLLTWGTSGGKATASASRCSSLSRH